MIRVEAGVLGEFLTALGRCAPAGAGRLTPPAVLVRSAGSVTTVAARLAGVGLTYQAPGSNEPAEFALSAADLRAGAVDPSPDGPGRVRVAWGDGAGRDLAAVDPTWCPPVVRATDWQPAGAAFVRAMRDAARLVRREAEPRYAYHRVLLDTPTGRVAAPDGVNLFVHGGFAWAADAPVAVVGVWTPRFWDRAGEPEVAFAADAVLVRAGPWSVSLAVDRAARFPKYGELLARLRSPVARVTLSEADAVAWAGALAAWAKAGSADDPVRVSLADPPALSRAGGGRTIRLAVAGSSFAGRRAVRATSAGRHLARALALGFQTITGVGTEQPLVALDGPGGSSGPPSTRRPTARTGPAPLRSDPIRLTNPLPPVGGRRPSRRPTEEEPCWHPTPSPGRSAVPWSIGSADWPPGWRAFRSRCGTG